MAALRSTGNVRDVNRRTWGWRAVARSVLAFALVGTGVVVTTEAARADSPVSGQVTRGNDTNRTNWYSNQPNLSPAVVSHYQGANPSFGQKFDTALDGQIMAQPLVANGVLVVATENNKVYGLDPDTGAILWPTSAHPAASFGAPYDPSGIKDSNTGATVGCTDLIPNVGITSTPVVDTTTNTIYLVANEIVNGVDQYRMHALDLNTGAEKTALGFPRVIQGNSDNQIDGHTIPFDASHQTQRPGLLLLNGVVYAGFSAHCQVPNWAGWVAGVNASTGAITALWADHEGNSAATSGGGIWMSGGGLASDGNGQILLSIGNALTPNPGVYDRNNPPAELSNAVVRLTVGGNGKLSLNDFFVPQNEQALDTNDLDLGSGGLMLLPDQFGTSSVAHLAVAAGKSGDVYLLDRDNLGGEQQGPGNTDAVVGRTGGSGGVWSQPSLWGGDGGYVYLPAASPSSSQNYGTSGALTAYKYSVSGNTPSLTKVATSSEVWGFGSSSVMVTSNGTTSGSALLWAIHSLQGASGNGLPDAELAAYQAVPTNGDFTKVFSAPIGTANKFTPPAVGPDGQIYATTYAGHVIGFGPTQSSHLTTSSVAFSDTPVGGSSIKTATFTATAPTTIDTLTSAAPFSVGTSTPGLPATLAAGESLTVPVTFSPTATGAVTGSITATTDTGSTLAATLTGTGLAAGPQLSISPPLDFGAVAIGTSVPQSVLITNNGSAQANISTVTLPGSPFSVTGAPTNGSTLAAGASIQATVTFTPITAGDFDDNLTVASDGGNVSVDISGTGATPPNVTITPSNPNFGNVPVGTTAVTTFQLTNTGGVPAKVTVSKPPLTGPFAAMTTLPEGSQIAPGATVIEKVSFTPTATGTATATWQITTTDGAGARDVTFSGTGVGSSTTVTVPPVGGTGWSLNGSATAVTGGVQLTTAGDANRDTSGSTFYSTPVSLTNFSAEFDANLSGGGATGADGLTLAFAYTDSPSLLGASGGLLGFGGINGFAVALRTYQGAGTTDPSNNFVGITDGPLSSDGLNWLATTGPANAIPNLRSGTVHVKVTAHSGTLTVYLNNVQVLTKAVDLPPEAIVGFTGANGYVTDNHVVTNTVITTGAVTAPPPAPPANSNGVYRTAIQANTTGLWLATVGGQNLNLGLMPGTSPAITSLPGGGYQIAFQANTGALWSTGTLGTHNWNLGMMAGTSPSITAVPGGFQIAMQANTGDLWTAGTLGVTNLHLGMLTGTSPSITTVGTGYQIAIQANTGALWTAGILGTHNWSLGMMAGTSPSITAVPGGFEFAFQANTGSLWTGGTASLFNWNLGMNAGTSPAISR